ncbi:MAG: helix-turn-helix domain-containing protein [Sulfolobales archaeon]
MGRNPPRGISSASLRVLELVAGEGATAAQIAKILGVRVSAVRKHLEKLEKHGLVRHMFVRKGVGRPRKVYMVTEQGIEALPKLYGEFLLELINRLTSMGLGERVEAVVSSMARDIALKSASKDITSSIENLNAFGFMGSVRRANGSIEIISRNCPLLKIAKSYYDLICIKFHTEILRNITGSNKIHLAECIVRGDLLCRHRIDVTEQSS